MLKKILVVACFLGVFYGLIGYSQAQFGIGAKFFSNAPFGLAFFRYGNIGAELSLGFSTTSVTTPNGSLSLTALFYMLDGKVFPLPLADFADVYAGVGGAGVTVTLTAAAGGASASISGTILGLHVTGGIEVRFPPIAIFGGGDWLMFFVPSDLSGGFSFPYSGGTYHLGLRYDF